MGYQCVDTGMDGFHNVFFITACLKNTLCSPAISCDNKHPRILELVLAALE